MVTEEIMPVEGKRYHPLPFEKKTLLKGRDTTRRGFLFKGQRVVSLQYSAFYPFACMVTDEGLPR